MNIFFFKEEEEILQVRALKREPTRQLTAVLLIFFQDIRQRGEQ